MKGNATVTMCTTERVRNLIQSKSKFFRRIVANRIHVASFLILVFLVRHASPDCSLNFEQYRVRRITALRFQILTKLGYSKPPEDYGPEEVPEDLLSLYNETVDLIEEKYGKNHKPCTSSASEEEEDEEDKYFAQVPMIFTAAENWPGWDNHYFYSRERFGRFYWFNISDLEGRAPKDITEATFRLYQVNNRHGMMDQVISVYKLVKKEGQFDKRHIYTKSFDPQNWGPVSIDVTEVVRSWVLDPSSNYGFQVSVECGSVQSANPWNSIEIEFGDPRGSYTASQQRGDMVVKNTQTPEKHPKLIVMTSGNYSKLISTEGNSRRKRSYPSSRRCDETVASCCKRTFYVNFQRDLKWDFIRQPKGFYPNYCAGNCLYIRADNSMYHQLIAYHRHTNPDGSPSPCCSPLSFKPLTVLYYEKSRPQIATLQNVVVDSCRCS